MRIGIICEGPTDEPAITNFLKASLTYRDITPEFVLIQPDNDRTKPSDGGWHAVLNWLLNNPPKSRIATYLSGGLFDDGLSAKRCDVLVFQMDSDILPSVTSRTGPGILLVTASRTRLIQFNAAKRSGRLSGSQENSRHFRTMNRSGTFRHRPSNPRKRGASPCMGVFSGDPERLKGLALCREFMTALHGSENRDLQPFTKINKSPDRRRIFCERHADGFRRLESQCRHYRELVKSLTRRATST